MLGSNKHFETLLHSLDTQITTMENLLGQSAPASGLASSLEELWAQRRSFKLLMLNRRIEASKRVVDFHRWREGNGALHLCTSRLQKSHSSSSRLYSALTNTGRSTLPQQTDR
jgi:hypothetical protein